LTKIYSRVVLAAMILVLGIGSFFSQVGTEENPPSTTSEPTLRLEDLERMALQNNPTLAQAAAAVRAVERARAALERAKSQPTPDLLLRGAFGYNFEELDALGGPTKLEGSIEVGIRVPLFDRNQGNVATTRADIECAEGEVRRLELALRASLASAFARYTNALAIVQRYQKDILPPAQKAYELYLARFKEMAAAYPQVLIAQRTLFQLRTEYINALVDLRQNAVQIRGLLLVGGLNAPGELRSEGGIEASETPGVKSGMQGAGIREAQEQR